MCSCIWGRMGHFAPCCSCRWTLGEWIRMERGAQLVAVSHRTAAAAPLATFRRKLALSCTKYHPPLPVAMLYTLLIVSSPNVARDVFAATSNSSKRYRRAESQPTLHKLTPRSDVTLSSHNSAHHPSFSSMLIPVHLLHPAYTSMTAPPTQHDFDSFASSSNRHNRFSVSSAASVFQHQPTLPSLRPL